jgi:hypothetical protein
VIRRAGGRAGSLDRTRFHEGGSTVDHIDLQAFDTDGAIAETAERAGIDRAQFFKRAGLAGAGLIGGAGVFSMLTAPAMAQSGALPAGDVDILNFALTLEYLEADFYRKGAAGQKLTGNWQKIAVLLAGHETTHVQTLQGVLGSAAIAQPQFDFDGIPNDIGAFIKTAFTLENTGVHAYLGQAGNIQTPAILQAAATIVTVEARHAAAIAMLAQQDDPTGKGGITPDGAFDVPLTKQQILTAVGKTGFIVG